MVATPKNGTFTFVGRSGRTYSVDLYLSDVAGAAVTFNPNGAAGASSQTFFKAPEDVKLVDYSQVTGTADTTNIVLTADNGILAGQVLRYANYLNSLATRPVLNIPFLKGTNISAQQNA